MSRLVSILGVVLALGFVSGCGDGLDRSDPVAVAAVVAADLGAWPEFVDKSRGDRLVVVEVPPVADGGAGSAVVVTPGPQAGKAEVERLLGYALMNIAKDRKLPDLGFVVEGEGWRVLLRSSETVGESLRNVETEERKTGK